MRFHHARTFLGALIAITLVAGVTSPAQAAVSTVDRLAGADRYETNATIVNATPTRASVVYIASGENFPDALTVAPLVAAEGARLLLTQRRALPGTTSHALAALLPSRVVIVGGPAAVDPSVEAQILTSAPGANIERIAGADRVETSLAVLDRLASLRTVSTVWVASGSNFPDALVAGAVAARQGHAIVLAYGSTQTLAQQIRDRAPGISTALVAGGIAAVPDATVADLQAGGLAANRVAGAGRVETAVAINRRYPVATSSRLVLASAENFPDALSGAVLSAAQGWPLYLSASTCASTSDVEQEANRLGVTTVVALGGTSALTDAAARLQPCAGDQVAAALSLINQQRTANGVAPLALTGCLNDLAGGWSQQLAILGNGTTHNPNLDAGARACGSLRWGENVGSRAGGAAPMVAAWMASPPHRANILNPAFTRIGIGVTTNPNGVSYWTLDFSG